MKTEILLFAVVFSFVFNGLKAQVNVGDSLALVDFYDSGHLNHYTWWHEENWKTPAPVRTWYGVTVTDNRVTALRLPINGINGYIPLSFGNLTSLEYLDLSWNTSMRARLPATIGNCKSLVHVDLSYLYQSRSGNIPRSLGDCSELQYLNMYIAGASGPIPAELGKLKKLTYLALGQNYLTGTIPASLGKLINLLYLDIYDNQLTGEIPASLGKLTELDTLSLGGNALSGSIPKELGNLIKLKMLFMWGNQLTGGIPATFGNLTQCETLSLDGNPLLGGRIPPEMGKMTALTDLEIANCGLTGEIPEALGNLAQLKTLDVRLNALTGEIPWHILKLKNLNYLSANDNKLTCTNNFFTDRKKYFGRLDLYNNQYTFDGLELVAQYRAASYANQAPIAIHKISNKLEVSAGGTLSNNTYKWYRVGNLTPTVVTGDSTFQPTINGRYYAQITNALATELTLYTDTVNCTLTAMENPVLITITPNPAREMISLSGLNNKSNEIITIADMSGYVWVRTISHQQSAMRINASRLKAGNYLVNVNDGKDVKTMMFVKE